LKPVEVEPVEEDPFGDRLRAELEQQVKAQALKKKQEK
jgi:hypothetical protein